MRATALHMTVLGTWETINDYLNICDISEWMPTWRAQADEHATAMHMKTHHYFLQIKLLEKMIALANNR